MRRAEARVFIHILFDDEDLTSRASRSCGGRRSCLGSATKLLAPRPGRRRKLSVGADLTPSPEARPPSETWSCLLPSSELDLQPPWARGARSFPQLQPAGEERLRGRGVDRLRRRPDPYSTARARAHGAAPRRARAASGLGTRPRARAPAAWDTLLLIYKKKSNYKKLQPSNFPFKRNCNLEILLAVFGGRF